MLRNAFFKSLRDEARPLLMWVLGVAFYVALPISIYPSIRHSAGQLQGYINSLPSAVRAAFLGSGGDFSPASRRATANSCSLSCLSR